MSPEMPIVPEASLQGLGEIEFAVRALSGQHAVSAFWGPYDGVLTNVQGAVFYPLLGTLGILIPDTLRFWSAATCVSGCFAQCFFDPRNSEC
jgi:hypothetical protein